VRWQELFDDLDGQAEAWQRAERDAEVADRTRAETGQVTLLSRLRSLEGRDVSLRLGSGVAVSGRLARLGVDWLLVTCPQEVLIPLVSLAAVDNLPWESVSPQGAGAVASRLTLSSVFRAMAVDRARVTVAFHDGSSVRGTPDRVGRDFVDLALHRPEDGPRVTAVSRRLTVAYGAISAVQREPSSWA
jgi:hypothetical protein